MEVSGDDREKTVKRIAYVLTIWYEETSAEGGRRALRIHLVEPVSEEERGFTQLEKLFQFIRVQVEKAELPGRGL